MSSQGASEGSFRKKRVIFEAHDDDQRDGATDFRSCSEARTMRFKEARRREVEAIITLSEESQLSSKRRTLVEGLQQQSVQKRELIKNYNADLSSWS